MTETILEPLWSRLQEPARPSTKPADFLLLLSALDEGWQILEAVRWLPFNGNDSGLYLVTIFHPRALVTRAISIRHAPEVDALLKNESVILVNTQPGD